SELRALLAESIPEEVIPSLWMRLRKLPLTTNGKINRSALPDIDEICNSIHSDYVPPRTPIEATLAEIWTEILGVGRIGVNDNFFELGGHSLLATKIAARIRNVFRLEIPLRTLFERNTIGSQAEYIEGALRNDNNVQLPPITKAGREKAL